MAQAKRTYILIIKVNKLFSFFSSRCFLKEIENMYSVFLSSYRNTRESLGELEKAASVPTASRSLKFPLVFLYLDRNPCFVFLKYLSLLYIFHIPHFAHSTFPHSTFSTHFPHSVFSTHFHIFQTLHPALRTPRFPFST